MKSKILENFLVEVQGMNKNDARLKVIAELEAIWAFGDAALGIMTFPNLISIIFLSTALKVMTKDYFSREHIPFKDK